MLQPVSPVSLSEHTHTSQYRARLTVKRIPELFFLRPSTSEWPAHPPHPRLIPPSQLAFNPSPTSRPPFSVFINVPYLLGIFWASRPAYATLGSAAIPLLTLFYFFFLNFCHSLLNALFSLIIAQLIMLIFL